MPYSDNLYSLYDDSDSEGTADALSPTDGYFASSMSASSNVAPRVPNVMVVDPTLQQPETSAESKAQEADQESLLNGPSRHVHSQTASTGDYSSYQPSTSPSTRSYSTQPTHTSSTSYAPSSSIATPSASRYPVRTTFQSRARSASVFSDAPPAYTASPASPLSSTSPGSQARNYNTFVPNMGIESERLLERDPESMGHPNSEEVIRTPFWNRRIRRRLPTWLSWRMLILSAVLLVVIIGFLASSYRVFKGDENRKTLDPPPLDDHEKAPGDPEVPEEPNKPLEPLQPTFCQDARYRFPDQIMSVDFSRDKSLAFVQNQHSNGGQEEVSIRGQVNVRQLDSGGYPRVVLEILTNDNTLKLTSAVDEQKQTMKISVPKRYDPATTDQAPCVEMRATIWVPKVAQLKQFSVSTVHLDVLMLDDLSLQVWDYSRLSSIVGDIVSGTDKPRSYEDPGLTFDNNPDYTFVPAKSSYTLNSRIFEVTTTTGHITGNWPLYDMLGLHAISGDIKVSITPEPVLESNPKAAVLSMSSVSGRIHATEPIHEPDRMPIREYYVDIHSTSGDIHGALAFGPGMELKSTASDIAVDLLPIINQDTFSASHPIQLETVTTTGLTAVRVLDPVWYSEKTGSGAKQPETVPYIPIGNRDPYDLIPPVNIPKDVTDPLQVASTRPFDCLQAVHKSTGADVGLRYPRSWVGVLEASTTSGKLTVKGKDVIIAKSTGGWAGSNLLAYKGRKEGASTISVKTLMGNVDAVFGDV